MRPVTRHPHVYSGLQGEPLEGTIHPSVGASPRKSQEGNKVVPVNLS